MTEEEFEKVKVREFKHYLIKELAKIKEDR